MVVAMSGGVDSSVAAALLKDQGYEVIGITMQIWPTGDATRQEGCCSLSAVEDAKRVAAKIEIPHYVLNFREAFARGVIDNFIEEYRRGHTPNPCIRCNQLVKFDLLLERAKALGARYLATGHYARVRYDEERERWLLLRGIDRSKDQSYALYTMTQDQLAHTLFPLGDLEKEETRRIAVELGLLVAEKPESQEICFVPEYGYREFLKKIAPELARPGTIVDTQGKVLGEHTGIAFYTVGQRKGLGIAAGQPMYVIEIDPAKNVVVVGEESELYFRRFAAKDVNLISVQRIDGPIAGTASIRYNMPDSPGILRPIGEDWVEFVYDEPQRAITPGQAAVFYQAEGVLGGGTIADRKEEETWKKAKGLTKSAVG